MFDEAYMVTNDALDKLKWLESNPVAFGARPDILRAACSYAAKLWCDKGILPFKCDFLPNAIKNCYHVEMLGDGVRLFVARVEAPYAIAPHSIFRRNACHQITLFPDEQTELVNGFLATYGDGGKKEFQFGRIGMPGQKGWLDSISLDRGAYKFTSNQEHEDLLVSLLDGVTKEGEKVEGQGKS